MNKLTDKTFLEIAKEQLNRKLIAEQTALSIVKYGYWNEHPIYLTKDWKEHIINNNTRQGYWEWVFLQIDREE